jgi:hypothetical protein
MITALLVVFIIIQDNNHVLKIDDLNMQTVLKAKEMFFTLKFQVAKSFEC